MHASVRAFLAQIIDYAGMFPPAKLPLEEALRNYLHYRKASPQRWMLGRFVCPAARLQELLALAKPHEDAALLSVTALGTQSPLADGFAEQLQRDLQAIEEFRTAWGHQEAIAAFEVAIPHGDLSPNSALALLVRAARSFFNAKLEGFLEIPMSPDWERGVQKMAIAIAIVRSTPPRLFKPGLKMRCGGVAADAFPDNTKIAAFIQRCNELGIWWKATAGLHHPRPHWDAKLEVWHHGFLNVFIAGILAQIHALRETDLVAILADHSGQHFRFEDDVIAWKNWSCTTAQIATARANFATSFGSCSFEEPCADLAALGLLD